MKTKTFFLSLLAGVSLCFSNTLYAQYHHSGGSSGGSGDGAWDEGVNAINLGVGFIGSGIGDVVGSGYSQSVGPAFELSYEHALGEHWGIGVFISYQSATATNSFTTQDYVYDPTTFQYVIMNYTTTDKYTLSLFNYDARGAYHFSAGPKFDPYVGIILGYCMASASDNETSNDPNNVNTGGGSSSISGIEYGGYVGARYYFSNHIGVWLELQYSHATFTYQGYSSSINTANILNLGITFKL